MLVHLSTKRCACCNKGGDITVIDIPFEDIKLSPFAIPCGCGYFYEGIHYSVSFSKWQVALAIAKGGIKYLEDGITTEKKFLEEVPNFSSSLLRIKEYEEQLAKAKEDLVNVSIPVPDCLWGD